jgi:1-acyl-sn-glycerol-3-phosphate acyltransferase
VSRSRDDAIEVIEADEVFYDEQESDATGGALVPVDDPHDTALPDPRLSDVDRWGRSERMRQMARALYEPIYSRWFRTEIDGLENLPGSGALLVANHAGALPPDAPVLMHGIEKETGRPVYGLADFLFRDAPVVGTLWARAGGVTAHPDNAYRLLHDEGQLVLVFPEGSKGPGKVYQQRYRLRRFGRGGFVEIAMRAGVPVVPVAIIGAEEAMPILTKVPALSRALGVPYAPITPFFPLLGPLGLLMYLPAKFRIRVMPPVHFDTEPGQDRYSRSLVMAQAERIRDMIQNEVDEMLRRRTSVWFG